MSCFDNHSLKTVNLFLLSFNVCFPFHAFLSILQCIPRSRLSSTVSVEEGKEQWRRRLRSSSSVDKKGPQTDRGGQDKESETV